MNQDFSISIMQSFEEINEVREFWTNHQWYHYADVDFYFNFAAMQEGFLRPYVILVSRERQPTALIAGQIVDRLIPWKMGYKTFHKTEACVLEIIYGGILGTISEPVGKLIVNKIFERLKRDGIDIVIFKFLKDNSIIHQAALEVPNLLCKDHFPIENIHWKLSLPDSFEVFYQQCSKNTKSNIRKYANRIKTKFSDNFLIKCCKSADEVEQTMEEIEKVAVNTYQRGLGVGFLNTERIRKEWLFAADHGWLRAYVLYLNDEPCAFLNGFSYQMVFYVSNLGFDRSYEYYHPGMFLMMRVIEEFCSDNGVEAIDFGPMYADYKRAYGNENWKEVVTCIFAPTLRGLKIKAIWTLTAVISKLAKSVLNRLKIINWIKRNWRRKLMASNYREHRLSRSSAK